MTSDEGGCGGLNRQPDQEKGHSIALHTTQALSKMSEIQGI